MIIIIAAGICSFITLVYFSRLMGDAKKLQERLRKPSIEFSEDVQVGEELLIKLDCARWTAPSFCKGEAKGDSYTVQFYSPEIEQSGADEESGRILESAVENPRVTSS